MEGLFVGFGHCASAPLTAPECNATLVRASMRRALPFMSDTLVQPGAEPGRGGPGAPANRTDLHFQYLYDPANGQYEINDIVHLRLVATMWNATTQCLALGLSGDEVPTRVVSALENGLRFYFERCGPCHPVQSDHAVELALPSGSQPPVGLVVEGDGSVGTNGLLVLSAIGFAQMLPDHPDAHKHLQAARRVCHQIARCVERSGRMVTDVGPGPAQYHGQEFYPGESLLALAMAAKYFSSTTSPSASAGPANTLLLQQECRLWASAAWRGITYYRTTFFDANIRGQGRQNDMVVFFCNWQAQAVKAMYPVLSLVDGAEGGSGIDADMERGTLLQQYCLDMLTELSASQFAASLLDWRNQMQVLQVTQTACFCEALASVIAVCPALRSDPKRAQCAMAWFLPALQVFQVAQHDESGGGFLMRMVKNCMMRGDTTGHVLNCMALYVELWDSLAAQRLLV